MDPPPAEIRGPVDDIGTPALVVDLDVSNQVVGDRKLRRLAALAQNATIALC